MYIYRWLFVRKNLKFNEYRTFWALVVFQFFNCLVVGDNQIQSCCFLQGILKFHSETLTSNPFRDPLSVDLRLKTLAKNAPGPWTTFKSHFRGFYTNESQTPKNGSDEKASVRIFMLRNVLIQTAYKISLQKAIKLPSNYHQRQAKSNCGHHFNKYSYCGTVPSKIPGIFYISII
jgi:hypothetical protein